MKSPRADWIKESSTCMTDYCGALVTHIVSLPHLEGDVYCVCAKHILYGKDRLGPRARVREVGKWEIASGCVFGLTRGDGKRIPGEAEQLRAIREAHKARRP